MLETEDQQKMRFQVELEFVQCLANPNYLNCKFGHVEVFIRFCNQLYKRYCYLTSLSLVIVFNWAKLPEWRNFSILILTVEQLLQT